jgi:hypothetical protein
MDRNKWTGGLAHLVSRLKPTRFVWAFMKWRMYHGGKPEARHQLVEAIDEATIGMRN